MIPFVYIKAGGSVLTIFGRSDFLGIFLKEMDFMYSVSQKNPDSAKNMLLFKNPPFLPNHYEKNEGLILTKFRNNWVKMVEFFFGRVRMVNLSTWGREVIKNPENPANLVYGCPL